MNIVLTGGSSGLGAAVVEQLQDQRVWILDVAQPQNLANKHVFIETDLADEESLNAAIANLPDSIGAVLNIAGIAAARDPRKVIAVNFLGLRYLSESLSPRLSPGGKVLNVSSIAGRDWQRKYERLTPLLATHTFKEGLDWCRAHEDAFARDPYTFSKRLVSAYTSRHAHDAVQNRYTINSVSPGPIDTPLYPEFESMMGKEQSDWTKLQTGRIAAPKDIAEVLVLLTLGNCGWLNGVDVPVDGGYSAGLASGWVDFKSSPVMQQRNR